MEHQVDIPQNIHQRIDKLIRELGQGLFEKEKLTRLALLSAISGESIFLLGPPGVAKSMVARRLKYAFHEARSFEYLMGKFSTPDEVFGPVSISKLKNEDKYERLTDKYLPGANVVFLDEIWKASPPIQNSLLTVLNEKIYRNGDQEFKVDIRGLIAASNELPLGGEGLEALWDRFLVRLVVKSIEDDDLFNQMITLPGKQGYEDVIPYELKITDEEFETWSEQIDNILVPRHILGLINHIRRTLRQRNSTSPPEVQMYVSDRRWRKITHLLRASAFLNERSEVNVMDCHLIADCIWNRDDQVEEAADLVLGSITGQGYRSLVNIAPIERELNSLREEIARETQIISHTKIQVGKTYRDKMGNEFYRANNFWGDTPAYIRVDDFGSLDPDKDVYIPIFEQSGKAYRPFQTISIRRTSGLSIINKGRELPIESIEKEKKIVTPKHASPRTIKIWNSQVRSMLDLCEKGLQTIEDRKSQDEPTLLINLFVENNLAAHVLESLDTARDDILTLKLDIQKTQHAYESIEAD